jgi:hypothetical protein
MEFKMDKKKFVIGAVIVGLALGFLAARKAKYLEGRVLPFWDWYKL